MKSQVKEIITLKGTESILWIGSKGHILQLSDCSLFIKVYFDNELFRSEYICTAVERDDGKNNYLIEVPKGTKKAIVILESSEADELQSMYICCFEKEMKNEPKEKKIFYTVLNDNSSIISVKNY